MSFEQKPNDLEARIASQTNPLNMVSIGMLGLAGVWVLTQLLNHAWDWDSQGAGKTRLVLTTEDAETTNSGGPETKTCEKCMGSGVLRVYDMGLRFKEIRTCTVCGGTGRVPL